MDDGDVAVAERTAQEESAINKGIAEGSAPAAAVEVPDLGEHARLQRALNIDVSLKEKDLEIVDQIELIESEKKSLKGLEKQREELIQELREAIRGERSDQPTLPFGESNTVSDAITEEMRGVAGTTEDDSWRDVPFTDPIFGFSTSILSSLQAAGLVTAGHYSDYMKAEGRKTTDIDGIGEAKATQIEDGMSRLFARRLANVVTEATSKPVITEPDASTVYRPEDLGFKVGMVAGACHPDLLAKSIGDRIPTLRTALKIGERRYVPVGTIQGNDSVYELRRLVLPVEQDVNQNDPLEGIQVWLGKERLKIGTKEERVVVDDSDLPAETANTDLSLIGVSDDVDETGGDDSK